MGIRSNKENLKDVFSLTARFSLGSSSVQVSFALPTSVIDVNNLEVRVKVERG
jgi:hypothetical protein